MKFLMDIFGWYKIYPFDVFGPGFVLVALAGKILDRKNCPGIFSQTECAGSYQLKGEPKEIFK